MMKEAHIQMEEHHYLLIEDHRDCLKCLFWFDNTIYNDMYLYKFTNYITYVEICSTYINTIQWKIVTAHTITLYLQLVSIQKSLCMYLAT